MKKSRHSTKPKKATKPRKRAKGPAPKKKVAAIKVREMPLEQLEAHPRNPRKHPKRNSPAWNAVKKSLEAGVFSPLVWNKRNEQLVSGHLRAEIMRELGMETAPVVVVDYDEPMHMARMLASNSQQGANEDELVAKILNEAVEADAINLTGFGADEIAKRLGLEEKVDSGPELDKPVFKIIVRCKDLADQERFITEMRVAGLDCKGVVV